MEAISAQCLLGACASGGNEHAWQEFFRRYRKGLESGVRRGLRRFAFDGPKDEVEDLMQEIYCRLLEGGGRRLRASRGTTDGEIGSYLRRLAENVVLDRVRAAGAAKREGFGLRSLVGREEGLVDPAPTKEEALLLGERAAGLLRTCRGEHQSAKRNAWIARKALLEGWSSREIAQALGGSTSTGAVDAVVSRVYRRLRQAGLRVRRRSPRRGPGRAASRAPGLAAAG